MISASGRRNKNRPSSNGDLACRGLAGPMRAWQGQASRGRSTGASAARNAAGAGSHVDSKQPRTFKVPSPQEILLQEWYGGSRNATPHTHFKASTPSALGSLRAQPCWSTRTPKRPGEASYKGHKTVDGQHEIIVSKRQGMEKNIKGCTSGGLKGTWGVCLLRRLAARPLLRGASIPRKWT